MEPPRRPEPQVRINDAIRVPRVRLIGEEGQQLGIKQTDEARTYAYGKGLDLVEVAPQNDPPVAKVMDYGKYRYEQEQKAKQARKNQVESQVRVKDDGSDSLVAVRGVFAGILAAVANFAHRGSQAKQQPALDSC